MTKIAAYTALQDAFGREQARALADFFVAIIKFLPN